MLLCIFLKQTKGVFYNMGYDDDECVYCYQTDGGNNTDCSVRYVCAVCADRLIQMDGSTMRYKRGWVTFLEEGICTGEGDICHLCNKTRHMLFRAPCCDDHEGAFEDVKDYYFSENDDSE